MTEESGKLVSFGRKAGCELPNQVNEEVVAVLRNILAEAERGEIVGLVLGLARPNFAGITTTWEPGTASALDMFTAAQTLNLRMSMLYYDLIQSETA